jgi:hypothetical protein
VDEVDNNIEVHTPDRVLNPVRGNKTNNIPHLCFSHLFNAYAQAYNKMYARHGSLFERPFKRKLIDNEAYLKQVVLYIHNNPVHHGFCNHPLEYAWSSFFEESNNIKFAKLRNEVFEWFGNKEEFDIAHKTSFSKINIENYLES